MRPFKIITITLLSLIAFSACNSGEKKDKSAYLPSISGKAGEVLIIIDKPYWEGEVGSELRTSFLADYPYLPQKEPIFTVYNAPHSAFKGTFPFHRNIVMVNISKKVDSTYIVFQKDVWAKPQIVISAFAKSKEEATALLTANRAKIVSAIEQKERDRIISNSMKFEELSIRQAVTRIFGGSPYFTKDYSLKKKTGDFIWISHETTYVNQGILIYKFPYTDPSRLTLDFLCSKIDSTLAVNVPGMRDNSYMTISRLISPGIGYTRYKNKDFIEVRGLWELKNDYMGGPFVCHIFPDKENKNIVVLQGFVYAPKFDKRNYLRYVESVLYSFDWAK